MKVRLAFRVIVTLYVMRSTAPKTLVFFHRKCASQESCRIRWVNFPCVFSCKMRLAFRSDCEFTCDAANCSRNPNIFPRKTRLAGGIPRGSHCHCRFSFIPTPGRKPNLDKRTLYKRGWVVRLSVPHKPRVNLARKGFFRSGDLQFFKTHVTPKGWDVKGGIPQTACWRLGCGEARQMLKHDRAIPKRQPFKGTQKKCNQMVLSMCTAQCGSTEAKALSFVLRAAGSEHHKSSTRCVFTYVVGGREWTILVFLRSIWRNLSPPPPISVPY